MNSTLSRVVGASVIAGVLGMYVVVAALIFGLITGAGVAGAPRPEWLVIVGWTGASSVAVGIAMVLAARRFIICKRCKRLALDRRNVRPQRWHQVVPWGLELDGGWALLRGKLKCQSCGVEAA